MPEVVGTFLSTELGYEGANCAIEPLNGSRGDLAQELFECAVGQFDGIEVGRVFRQVAKCRANLFDGLFDPGNLVCSVIIHRDDIVAMERRSHELLNIGEEYLSGHGPFDHHRGDHFVVTQRGHEGHRLPCSERDAADQSNATRSAPPEPHQIRAHRRLVDKHQPRGVKHALLPDPAPARTGHVRPLPLGGLQTFF